MNDFSAKTTGRVFVLHLKKDEDILEEIRAFIKRENVKNAVVLTGVGTIKSCAYHGVVAPTLPASDKYYNIVDEPIEFSGLSGIIADYEPHLHITFTSFTGEFKTCTAHIEPGCKILCLGEITILELADVDMSRRPDEDNINQLEGEYAPSQG